MTGMPLGERGDPAEIEVEGQEEPLFKGGFDEDLAVGKATGGRRASWSWSIPTVDAAKRWYASDESTQVKPIRLQPAVGHLVLVEGVEPITPRRGAAGSLIIP